MAPSTTVLNKRSTGVLLLLAIMIGPFMGLLDVSIVTIALPDIGRDLEAPLASAQWIVDGYSVALSSLMLTTGTLGDRFGRKRVFLGGLAVFTLASATCALAPGPGWLIAARFLQGAGASVLMPGALSLIAQTFPERNQRARMLGLLSGLAGSAVVLGPVLGGPLTDTFGWQSIFWLNVPLGLVAFVLGVRSLPESADPDAVGLDPWGQVLAIGWIAMLAYAAIHAGHAGVTSPRALLVAGTGVATLIAFVAVERRSEQPMLSIGLFGRATFGIVNLASFVVGFAVLGVFFLLSLYLQEERAATATEAGFQLIPYAACAAGSGLLFGRLNARFGARRLLLTGFVLLTLAAFGIVLIAADTPYAVVAAILAMSGLGIGLSGGPLSLLILHASPSERTGMASATVNMTRQVGVALGIAVLGAVASSGPTFVIGLHRAFLVSGLLLGLVTVLLFAVRRRLT